MKVIKLAVGSIVWMLALSGFLVLMLFGLVPPRSVRDERGRAEAARLARRSA